MRITKILLVLAFMAVSAIYAMQEMADRFSRADVPPAITCDSEVLELSVKANDSALLTGVTASDAQDGDLTDRVLVSGVSRLMDDGTAKVTYVVFDSDDNMATATRRIRYTDYRLPRFYLNEPLVYAVGEQIQLLDRLGATDVVDGDITGAIRVTYTDSTAETGVHSLNVQVTNSLGDTTWQTLPVIIQGSLENRVEVTLDTYLIYLERGGSFRAADHLVSASYNGDSVSLSNVSITGTVDTGTPGTYMVHYTGVYGSRNGTVILTVVVE